MTPDDVGNRLTDWEDAPESWQGRMLTDGPLRRVVCAEDEGPRRTWTLWQDGSQVGHARGRQSSNGEWAWEAANAGLAMIGGRDAGNS